MWSIPITLLGAASIAAYFIYLLTRRRKVGNFFDGKTVLITGASSGLGEALASRLARENGISIILAARNKEALDTIAQKLQNSKSKENLKLSCYKLDLSDPQNIDTVCDEILSCTPNGIDILINNAGISMRGDCMSTTMSVHRRLMEVNYFGHVHLTQRIFAKCIAAGQKSNGFASRARFIVNIGSVQGRIAIPFRSAYAASKHAFNAYFDSLKGELKASGVDNVSILTVNPGYLRTNLSLNALTSTGDVHGRLDVGQSQGMDVDSAATAILDAVASNRHTELLLCPLNVKIAILLRSLLPQLYFYMMAKRARRQNSDT